MRLTLLVNDLFFVFLFVAERLVFLLPGFRDAIGFRSPLPQVDQLAALRTEWAIVIAGLPDNNLAALRTIDDGFLHIPRYPVNQTPAYLQSIPYLSRYD